MKLTSMNGVEREFSLSVPALLKAEQEIEGFNLVLDLNRMVDTYKVTYADRICRAFGTTYEEVVSEGFVFDDITEAATEAMKDVGFFTRPVSALVGDIVAGAVLRGLTRGSMSSAVRACATVQGMDPHLPPLELWDALTIRHSLDMDRMRRMATVGFNLVAMHLDPGRCTYYDVMAPVYPDEWVERHNATLKANQERARQMKAVEEMRAMNQWRKEHGS